MSSVKNILFVMADQLRWDFLSCYGHEHLHTPNIDRLAERGVRFDRAYVQSPVCGPSRASVYTGRTVFSHGSTFNRTPLPIGEKTVGEYMEPLGVRTAVVGKTHMVPDIVGMKRLGLDETSPIWSKFAKPAFEPFELDNGMHPTKLLRKNGGRLRYNDWLRQKGYEGENPWNDYANSAEGPDGEILSGWYLKNSNLPARIEEKHSETPYMVDRAMEFIEESGDQPWLCHLSLIKPHWPYMVPAPYHDMYGPDTWSAIHRDTSEQEDAHPVYKAFTGLRVSEAFTREGVRETVMPAYMGLIKQIDDHLGRLFKFIEDTGRDKDTMIVMTSDHGDYLGDHWMGEKELFHECSVRVPLIVLDPRPAADATRGTVSNDLVESIDLLPTFIDSAGGQPDYGKLEGRSLIPILHGETSDEWREAAFSEIDFSFYGVREMLGTGMSDSRAYMIRTSRWKYIHYIGFPPQLFDLVSDPDEFSDVGRDPAHADIRNEMQSLLLERLTGRKNRVTISDEDALSMSNIEEKIGVLIGFWDETELT